MYCMIVIFLLSLLGTSVSVKFTRPPNPAYLERCGLDERSADAPAQLSCWMDCLNDPCCRAVDIIDCEKYYFPAKEVDFIKEDVPAGEGGECSCNETTGGSGGEGAFQLPSSDSSINVIVAAIDPVTGALTNLGVEYEDGTGTDHESWGNVESCLADQWDHIEQVTVYFDAAQRMIGIDVITSDNGLCLLFGTSEGASKVETVSGHMLMAIAGHRTGGYVDQLIWTFDRGCSKSVQ